MSKMGKINEVELASFSVLGRRPHSSVYVRLLCL